MLSVNVPGCQVFATRVAGMMTAAAVQPRWVKRSKSHWSSSRHSGLIGWFKPTRVPTCVSSVTDSCQQGLLESFLRDPCDSCVELSVWQRQRLRGPLVKLNWCVKQRVINKNKNYTSVGGWLSVARFAERLGLCHHASNPYAYLSKDR